MNSYEEWEKLSVPEKKRMLDDLKKFMEDELEEKRKWLEKMMKERPSDVHTFVFVHGRLPQPDELD